MFSYRQLQGLGAMGMVATEDAPSGEAAPSGGDTVIAPSVGTSLAAGAATSASTGIIGEIVTAVIKPLADVGAVVGVAAIQKAQAAKQNKVDLKLAMINQTSMAQEREFLLAKQARFLDSVGPIAKAVVAIGVVWFAASLLRGRSTTTAKKAAKRK